MLATNSLKRVSTEAFFRACIPKPDFGRLSEELRALPGPSRDLHRYFATPACRSAQKRPYSTVPKSSKKAPLFSASDSTWDDVFKDIEDYVDPNVPRSQTPPTTTRSARTQEMNAREVRAFEDMFATVFEAVEQNAAAPQPTQRIGRSIRGTAGMEDLFKAVRKHTRKVNWTTEADEALDRLKEDMEHCTTDQELLQWALKHVFGEDAEPTGDAPKPARLNPAVYPHILAHLMQTFREKYADPHVVLALFEHARHLSLPSFVFGCTTPVYNELLETRWRCFRDLRGVCDALEEMHANGIAVDARTRALAEAVRRDVGARTVWAEETSVHGGEVWEMIARIEHLTAVKPRRGRSNKDDSRAKNKRWTSHLENWQDRALQGDEAKDGWQFGAWDDPVPRTKKPSLNSPTPWTSKPSLDVPSATENQLRRPEFGLRR